MFNRIILVGRLTADPELRYTPSGTPVASFRIAVDRPTSRAQGERQTDFINIVAWQQRAEFAANYLTKGRLVLVEGRLQIRQWTTSEGMRRQTAEVVSFRVQPLDRRREEGAPPGEAEVPQEAPQPEDTSLEEEEQAGGPWEDQ